MAKLDKSTKTIPATKPEVIAEEPVTIPLRVSVIVITLNQVDALRRTLASLERSVPREMLEILVVDPGSSDATRDIEASYPAIKLLRTPRNFGWTKSANIGTRTAKGDFLFFLPPGVEVQPDTVARLAAVLDAESDVTVVCPLERNAAGETIGRSFALPSPAELSTRVSSGQWPMASGNDFPAGAPIMIRRQAIVQINYLDEKRYGQFGADLDLFYQIKRGGRRVALAADAPVVVASRPTELATGSDPVDMAHGAATYAGKWFGFGAGLGMRIKFALGRLGSFDLPGFVGVLSGSKTDGK
jgi:glycosyltransferase involved in cell wall biosynthesis